MSETVTAKGRAAIDTEIERLREYIAQAETYATEAALFDEFDRAFPSDPDDYHSTMRPQIGIGAHVLNGFLIAWDARRLEDVKPRLQWLAKRLGKYKIEDFPEMGRRTYDFGRLKLMVFFNTYDEKTVCKFVEVGTETKPVYKLMCGADEVTEATA